MDRFLSLPEIKALSSEEAGRYCSFLRKKLVEGVTQTGGHLASNLGIVEISVALSRVMDLPLEKVVYDTGHQSYVHKMLTGRGEDFSTLRTYGGISGFPRMEESEYDAFGTGHSGTGISAALGLARAKKLCGEDGFCVAVIGDGSFTGGMVFEALNNIAPDEKLIIILNDNGMSISRSVGRIKSHLNRMRNAKYYRLKNEVEEGLERVPVVGKDLARFALSVKKSVKRSALPWGNLFEQFGLHYFGPADGNDVETVEVLLREAKKKNRPSLIHLVTRKGKGYEPALRDPSRFHGISPAGEKSPEVRSNSALFGECMVELAEKDPRIAAITAAMADGVGLSDFARRFPDRFFDVGIAEEHAMTFGAALAAGGMKPVFAVYSTFYQRAVDCLIHDAALQKLPLVVALDRAGVSGEDGATHHGLFDLPLTLFIPGVKVYAPMTREEMMRDLKRALAEETSPSVIRYAKGGSSITLRRAFPFEKDIEWIDFGSDPTLSLVTFGRMTESAYLAAKELEKEGISLRLIRFGMLKGFSEEEAKEAFSPVKKILFVEEGAVIGGFSRYLEGYLKEAGISAETVSILGAPEAFVPHGKTTLLLEEMGLSAENIRKEVKRVAEA